MSTDQRVAWPLIVASLIVSLVFTLLPMPAPIAAARPALYVMTVMFWVATQPRYFGPIAAWCCGTLVDVLYGTPFAEHGLAMAIAAYAVLKARRLLGGLGILPRALVMLPVFAVYEFVLFWVDGVARLDVDPWWRWLPALSSAALWPIWAFALERVAVFRLE